MGKLGMDAALYFMANAVIYYAIKRSIAIFISEEECRWKHTFFLYVLAWLFTGVVGYTFSTPSCKVIANIAALFLLLLPYRVRVLKKVLMVFSIYAVSVLVDTVAVLPFTKYYIEGKPIVSSVTSLSLLLLVIILERTVISDKKTELPTIYMLSFCTVPVISIACIYYMAVTIVKFRTVIIVIATGLLFINIFILYLYHFLLSYHASRMEKQRLEQTIQVYHYQMDLMKESQELVNELRHDLKHHLIELGAMARANRSEQIVQYLDDMKKFILNPAEQVSSGNQEVDGILNYLLKNVDKMLNQADIQIQIPSKRYEKNFDICVILGNLVENAVQAAKQSEEKYLLVHMQDSQGILTILVENSYSGQIKEEHNRFLTSKENSSLHGFGLESVKKVVAQNGGDIDISYTDKRFKAEVLLYLSAEK